MPVAVFNVLYVGQGTNAPNIYHVRYQQHQNGTTLCKVSRVPVEYTSRVEIWSRAAVPHQKLDVVFGVGENCCPDPLLG